MKKWYSLLKSLFLLTLFLICTHNSVMVTQAEEDPGSKCGLAEFEVVYDEDLEYIPFNNKYSMPGDVRAYWTCFANDYYYNQLTDVKRQIWDAMEEVCITLAAGNDSATYATVAVNKNLISRDELIELLYMFKYSNPQYYFLQNGVSWNSNATRLAAGIKIYEAFQDGEVRKYYTNMFCEKVNGWSAQVANAGREEDKVKLAHDIIASNTYYDFGAYNQSAFSMVCEGRTVCAGYAAALQLLLNPNGIRTAEVTSSIPGYAHAWNIVEVHGEWYIVDVTWDDNEYGTRYWFYMKSENTCLTNDRLSSNYAHFQEEMWNGYVPELKYDSIDGDDYHSPYFKEGTYEYFTVNDNPNLDSRYTIVLNDDGQAPPTVTHNANTYKALNVPEGRRKVPHYDKRKDGGEWDGTYYKLNGKVVKDAFFCDGQDTYYLMADGTPMKDRLTYHPDGAHVIYFDANGHEVFNDFAFVGYNIYNPQIGWVPLNKNCYFDGNGYQYTNVVTWGANGTNREGKLYYANPYGVLESGGWFTFSDTAKYAGDDIDVWPGAGRRGYANADCSLMRDVDVYGENGGLCHINGYGALE